MSDTVPTERYADDAHRYLLEARIATGGMGQVWRARDTVLDRPVAVKLLKAEYADDPLFVARFETEARHAGALHHPGIASVFDFGQASPGDGSTSPLPYLVMELVEGQPLSNLLRPSAPMDAAVAQDLMAQTAAALGAAHAAGIVHRDVKPANLLVTPDRRVKVTDFGIARAADGVALTQTGQVMGTPQYLSPEQAEGRRAGPASDVYSLGVVAFECLAGRRPFVADSPVATALAHVRQPVPDLPDDVPADLAGVVRRAMAKDPEERYADGTAFAAALREPAAHGGPVVAPAPEGTRVMPAAAAAPAVAPVPPGTPPPTPDRRRRGAPPWLPWALLALALLVGLVVLLNLTGDDTTERPQQQQRSRAATPDTSSTSEPTSEPTSAPQTSAEEPAETQTSQDASVEVDPADYVGRDRKDVEKELRDLSLKVSSEKVDNDGSEEEGTVESLDPTGTLQEGDQITVFYFDKPDDDSLTDELTGSAEDSGNGSSDDSTDESGRGNG